MSDSSSMHRVALVGNPNAGKTTLFNALTGSHQKVGNFSGVTVAKKSGDFRTPYGVKVELIDLPGCYSLDPNSKDEQVTRDVLQGNLSGEIPPEAVICVVDASALERHLPLVLEVIELGLPVIIALNMIDVAEQTGVKLDPEEISRQLGVSVIPIQANKQKGCVELKQALQFPLQAVSQCSWRCDDQAEQEKARAEKVTELTRLAARRESEASLTWSDKLDHYLLNPWFGWPVLGLSMLLVFYSLFTLSSYPMDFVEGIFVSFGSWVESIMPAGDLRDLITGGVIAGLGGTIIFLPQIIILFFFIGLMETSGYMSRAAYIMDGLMARAGLSGSAFLPLLSAHACAIPGIMGARSIRSKKERLITILIAPWMSCTARLPVYTTIIALLLPSISNWVKAGIMLGIYSLGILGGLIAARYLRSKLAEDKQEHHFILELPPYRAPQLSYLFRHILSKSMSFLKRAGTVILGISILLWAMETYPKPKKGELTFEDSSLALKESYMGQVGQWIEPVVKPLGYDWRTGTAVLASFAAREVFISNLAITFAAESEDDGQELLEEKLAAATWPDGRKLYTPMTLLSLLVFFIYALQCFPTSVVVAKETDSWKWAIGQFIGMSAFAYLAALIVYQTGRMLGYA